MPPPKKKTHMVLKTKTRFEVSKLFEQDLKRPLLVQVLLNLGGSDFLGGM